MALTALVGACAPKAPITLQPPPGPPPGAEGPYRGTARLVRAEDRTCPKSGPRVLEVQGGSITLSYGPSRQRVPLTAEIQADGRIQASDGVGTMEGQLRDGRLEVTIASRLCEHRWTLTRRS